MKTRKKRVSREDSVDCNETRLSSALLAGVNASGMQNRSNYSSVMMKILMNDSLVCFLYSVDLLYL